MTYFHDDLIDDLDGATTDTLIQALRPYHGRDGDASDRVGYAIIVSYIDSSGRYGEVSDSMTGFLKKTGAKKTQYGETQSTQYQTIAKLSPKELEGRDLSLDALEAVGSGPVQNAPEQCLVRARIIDLGERANRKKARKLKRVAGEVKLLLDQGQPLAAVLQYLDEAMNRREPPPEKEPETPEQVVAKMEQLAREMQVLAGKLPENPAAAQKPLAVLEPVYQLLVQRVQGGEENPGMPERRLFEGRF